MPRPFAVPITLSDEGRAAIQASVDETYEQFVADVARGRGVEVSAVRDGFGEGRMVRARQAVKLGMADRIGTFESTLARLTGRGSSSTAMAEEASPELQAEEAAPDQLAALKMELRMREMG